MMTLIYNIEMCLCVLMPVLGTVEISNTTYFNAFTVLNTMLPVTDEDAIYFFLYTRNNTDQYQELKINDTAGLLRSNINFDEFTKVIVHGWISNNSTMLGIEMLKNAYINKTDYNVIVVDWNKLADGQYKSAHNFASKVSLVLTEFLKFLVFNGLSTDKLHLIGHSLGAHIAGTAGKYFRIQKNMIDAITGLDPAYPRYRFCSEDQRLNKEDARHVEVVHSNGRYWGFREALGHVDFYPNGDNIQPGCYTAVCAHDRALWYYMYSITTLTPYVAVAFEIRTSSEVYVNVEFKLSMSGLNLNYGEEGTFYFRTEADPPFKLLPDDKKQQTKKTRAKKNNY